MPSSVKPNTDAAELRALEVLSNVDAEQAVLAILLDPLARNDYWRAKCAELHANLQASDFFRPAHQAIYEALLAVREDTGEDGDFAAIVARLPNDLRAYAASLPPLLPSCAHAGYYAMLIREAAVKRRAVKALAEAATAFYDPERTAQDAIQLAHEALDMATGGTSGTAGIFEITDLTERITDLYNNGAAAQGHSTGWRGLDWPARFAGAGVYQVVLGEWTLLTGIPSHGKSSWLDALMVNLAEVHGWRFAVCSPENQPLERHAAKLAKLWTGQPFDRGQVERMTLERLFDALAWEYEHFTFVLPHERSRSVGGVLAVMEAVIQRHDLHGIVIDPWNELDHSRPSAMREDEWVSKCLSQIRNFARRHRVHVWLVAHPTKLQKIPGQDKYPIPRPYDVSGAAHWYNKADNCLTVYRDDEDRWVQVHVQKARFEGTSGQKGVAEFSYDKLTGRYSDHYSGHLEAA